MNNPLVSIIVPCYNQANYLDEALYSVFNQVFKNWECIIVNDGSTDNTNKKSKEWSNRDKRFKYLYKENGGLSSARNAGIKIAMGEFILPLDADDKIDKYYLQKIIEAFDYDKDLSLVYCDIVFFDARNDNYILPNYNYKQLLIQNCFVSCSAFRKEDWEKVDGFDENMKSFEDWEFWIRILNEKSKVFKIQEKMFFYRKHTQGSLSNSFKVNHDFYFSLYDYVYNKHRELYSQYFPNPILAYNENLILKQFNEKIKNTILFKLYSKIKNKK